MSDTQPRKDTSVPPQAGAADGPRLQAVPPAAEPPATAFLAAGVVAGVLWAAGAAAYLLGFHGPDALFARPPGEVLGLAFVSLGPAVVFGFLGWAGREVVGFSRTAHRLEWAAARLSMPVDMARGEAKIIADAIAEQIDRLNRVSEGGLARLAAMEEVLRHHAQSMQQASGDARKEVDALISNLDRERAAIAELSTSLSSEAQSISATLDRQAEMVRTAADLAARHAEQGKALLDASAEGLKGAGAGAQQAGERVALSIDEQIRDMEVLVSALDQRAVRMEKVADIHRENVKTAQATATELAMAAETGIQAMREASDTAIDHARRLAQVIAEETRNAAHASEGEIERVRRAAEAARAAADGAAQSLESHAQNILSRVERLNQESERAATRTSAAFEERVAAVESAINTVDERIAQLPRTAETRARQLHRALEDGLAVLERTAARAGARDLDTLPSDLRTDGSWQDDSAVRAADLDDGAEDFSWRDEEPPARRAASAYEEPQPGRSRSVPREAPFDARRAPPREPARGERKRRGPYDDLDDDDTGSLHDSPPARAPRQSASREPAGEDGLRWRDLLKNMDDAPAGADIGESVLISLRQAGVEPASALPLAATARVARARRRAGVGEARALVLDSALAEVRRTAAALDADPALRERVAAFVDDHGRAVRRAVDHNDAAGLAGLLDSDVGRAYLLADAALADI